MLLYNYLIIILLITLINSTYSINYEFSNDQCYKKTDCIILNSTNCLDIKLSYKYSKLNGLLEDFDFKNEQEIQEFLNKWINLKSVPRCWASIQPLLCTAFFPRCDEEKVALLSLQICKNVKANCKILDQYISSNNIKKIPSFLNCNDTNLYQPKCKNELIDIKFNSSAARCQSPLVSTDDSNIYYKNIEGCALDCDDPLYHKIDKVSFQNFIIWAGCLSLIIVSISIISYIPKWSKLGSTSKIIFYIQICFIIHYLGWLMQLFLNKKQIVCRSDQTLKYSEPNGSLSCTINFILIYYSAFSILIWHVIMASTLKMTAKNFKDYQLYFHLCAWSTSFVFTIMGIAFSQIDGSFVYGICFIGLTNKISRFIFILIPLTIGSLFFIYGMLNQAIPVNSMIHQSTKLKENIIERNKYKKIYKKLVICSLIMLIILVFSYIVHFNKNNDLSEWLDSLNDKILCQLNLNSVFETKNSCNRDCSNNLKRSLTLDYWIIVFVFGSGILSSFWNFDLITIILWIFEFKQKIDKIVRPNKIEQRNIFFEKLLHNKEDPVKMNLSTMLTNPNSNMRENDHDNCELNQQKSHDLKSNPHKLYEIKKQEKLKAKEIKKNSKTEYDNGENIIEMNPIQQFLPNFDNFNQLNHLNHIGQINQMNHLNQLNSFNHFNQLNQMNQLNQLNQLNQQSQLNNVFNNQGMFAFNNLNRNGILPNSLINENLQHDVNKNLNNMKNTKLNEQKRNKDAIFKAHGMSDQNKLMNPFQERRRPDSRSECNKNENLQNGLQNVMQNNNTTQQKGNLKMTSIEDNLNSIQNVQQQPANNNLPFHGQLPNQNQMLNLPVHMPFMHQVNIPNQNDLIEIKNEINRCEFEQQRMKNNTEEYYNKIEQYKQQLKMFLMFNQLNLIQLKNISEISDVDMNKMKHEIQETIRITACRVDSASDTNDFLPITIKDSDVSSICSIDSYSSFREYRKNGEKDSAIIKEVQDRLKTLNDDDLNDKNEK